METSAAVATAAPTRARVAPAWDDRIEAWRRAGLARELVRSEVAPFLVMAPSAQTMAQVLTTHYHARGDVVERAWRSQSDRYLELPDAALAPEVLVSALHLILPEGRVGIVRHVEGIELRLASNERLLAKTGARVLLRTVATHARRPMIRSARVDRVPSRSFVYAVNAMLETRGAPVRFLPLVSLPDRRAWVATTLDRAIALEDAETVDPRERWRDFCRYNDVVIG